MERAAGLEHRLDAILLQLPPTLKADADLLRECLAQFPAGTRVAVEPRHESWWTDEIRALLERYGAALCWADRDEKPVAPLWRTTDWGYLRFHHGSRTGATARRRSSSGPTGWPRPGRPRRTSSSTSTTTPGERRRSTPSPSPTPSAGPGDADPRAHRRSGHRPAAPGRKPGCRRLEDGGVLGVPDPELLGRLPEQPLHGEGVGERHDRALGRPARRHSVTSISSCA